MTPVRRSLLVGTARWQLAYLNSVSPCLRVDLVPCAPSPPSTTLPAPTPPLPDPSASPRRGGVSGTGREVAACGQLDHVGHTREMKGPNADNGGRTGEMHRSKQPFGGYASRVLEAG